jgi:hypothetical protein
MAARQPLGKQPDGQLARLHVIERDELGARRPRQEPVDVGFPDHAKRGEGRGEVEVVARRILFGHADVMPARKSFVDE